MFTEQQFPKAKKGCYLLQLKVMFGEDLEHDLNLKIKLYIIGSKSFYVYMYHPVAMLCTCMSMIILIMVIC